MLYLECRFLFSPRIRVDCTRRQDFPGNYKCKCISDDKKMNRPTDRHPINRVTDYNPLNMIVSIMLSKCYLEIV